MESTSSAVSALTNKHPIIADGISSTAWTLVREFGLEYAAAQASHAGETLHHPVYAARTPDGSRFIVDELGVEKSIPVRAECRTIRVGEDGAVLFDSREAGFPDGYGQVLDDGSIALLRRMLWEIWIVSPRGRVVQKLGLSTVSKRLPRTLSWTHRNTFLITFVDRVFEVDVAEVDRTGAILWRLPNRERVVGCPGGVQLLTGDNLLFADEFRHAAVEIDRAGKPVWEYGGRDRPSSDEGSLAAPKSVRRSAGECLIADSRNHRVLSLTAGAASRVIRPKGFDWVSPSFADRLADGGYLVCDAGNRTVVELDQQGTVTWQFGEPVAVRRHLSFPRSVEVCPDGAMLVADTAQNRLVEVADGDTREVPFRDRPGLFWPRCARTSPAGTYLVADGRNSRVLEVSRGGDVLHEFARLDMEGGLNLGDPHDVRLLENGHLLLVDPGIHAVVETDWSGHVYRAVGRDGQVTLKDPHSAQAVPDGTLLIADTGQNRVVCVDREGRLVQVHDHFRDGTACYFLHGPRYAEVSEEGLLVVADTGNNRVLAARSAGELVWELSAIRGSRLPFLNQPRWTHLLGRDELLISDHYHHRILHVQRAARPRSAVGSAPDR